MLRNWLRRWLGVTLLEDAITGLPLVDKYDAFICRGVACPYDGVGAMGFNPTRTAVHGGKSEYYAGQTRTVRVAGSGRGARPVVLEFVGGVLVDRGKVVER